MPWPDRNSPLVGLPVSGTMRADGQRRVRAEELAGHADSSPGGWCRCRDTRRWRSRRRTAPAPPRATTRPAGSSTPGRACRTAAAGARAARRSRASAGCSPSSCPGCSPRCCCRRTSPSTYLEAWLYELKMPSAALANPNVESSGLLLSLREVDRAVPAAALLRLVAVRVVEARLDRVPARDLRQADRDSPGSRLTLRKPGNGMFGGAFVDAVAPREARRQLDPRAVPDRRLRRLFSTSYA